MNKIGMENKNRWYEKSYRRNLVDMHIDDWHQDFLSKIDVNQYIELLKKANVQSVMFYAQSHVGYCNWPTKSGYMHKNLKGKDFVKEMLKRLHEEEMDAIVYYSLIFNNWAYDNHPEWRIIDVNGNDSRNIHKNNEMFIGSRYGVCCPNSKGYRNFVREQVSELCDGYEFEGIFFDMTFWPHFCFCKSCQERFINEYGKRIPVLIDWNHIDFIEFQKAREKWLIEFAVFVTDIVRNKKPEATVEHNSAAFFSPWRAGTTLPLIDASDLIGGDLYGGFLQQTFLCKYLNNISKNKPFEYMTSRCDPNLYDHTSLKTEENLKLHNYVSLAHQGAFLFIDAINPDGSLNKDVYSLIGGVFEESSRYERFIGGEIIKDVNVYLSINSKIDLSDNGKRINESLNKKPHLDAAIGAVRFLKEAHIPYDVISRGQFEELSSTQILVIPDLIVMDDYEAGCIRDFVSRGGSLYVSGHTPVSLLEDVLGVIGTEDLKETKETLTYIAPAGEGVSLFPGISEASPLSLPGPQRIVKALSHEEIIGTITLPYTVPGDNTKFAAIHSNPPGIKTSYPAIVFKKYGKGKVVWVSYPIETIYKKPHQDIFLKLIDVLKNNPFSYMARAHKSVEILIHHQKDKKRYILSVINAQELLPPIPVNDIEVSIRFDGKTPLSVTLLPDECPVDYTLDEKYLNISVPTLEIFHMIAVDYL